LTCIGSDTNEQLDFVPARVHVLEHHRYKYACYHCEDTVKTAGYAHQPPIPKSMAAPGLLSQVVVSKFQDHLPLYRQATMFQRMGVDLDRKTLSNWLIQVGQVLKPLIKLMQARLQAYDVAYADETPVQVLKEHGRSAQTQSYMWVFMGGQPSEFSILYHDAPSRSSAVARSYLDDFAGTLHCDAYSAYQALTNDQHRSVQLAACWAHVRRKFVDITRVMKQEGLAHQALRQINRLYHWERWAKQQSLDAQATREMRQQQARPLVEQFEAWCQRHRDQVPPKSAIGAAIRYALNHMASLKTYLDDGRLEIDNNRAERRMKPFVTGRKNWLFMGNAKGAEAAANLFSLVETCRHHGLDPYSYFKYVLTHIQNAETMEQLEQLLPFYVERQALLNQYQVTDLQ
jgi:transposase